MPSKTTRFSAQVFALFLLAASPSIASAAKAKKSSPKVETKKEEPLTVLNKWFALGSGCKAQPDKPGDVTLEQLPQDKEHLDAHKVKFSLPKFEFSFPVVKNGKAGKAGARECSLRINVNPPKGKILKAVTANTSLVASKTEKVELTTYVGLKLGIQAIGSTTMKYEVGKAFSNKQEDIVLVPGRNPEENFPPLKCGEPKIISVDYSFIAQGEPEKDTAHVTLAGDKSIVIVADLADCKE